MSFKSPKEQHKSDPYINHGDLVKAGPKLLTIKSVPKVVTRKSDQKRFHIITLELNGVNHTYYIPNKSIEDSLKEYVGKTVVVIASGNDKQGTATMEVQVAMVKGSELNREDLQKAPQLAEKPAQETAPVLEPKDREAKVFLCQAANLMRLCVKKANDIAVELGLPETHRQGIATTLFIQADRQGHIFKMPVSAYSPDQLGWGASKADSPKTPQPEEEAK